MKITARKAVDPIIATLLLIAIAVAAGIIVYVYVNSLAGNLTGTSGQQVSEGLSMDTFNFNSLTAPTVAVRDTGGGSITLASVFVDGLPCQTGSQSCTAVAVSAAAAGLCTPGAGTTLPDTCTTGQYTTISLTVPASYAVSGTSHLVRVVTSDGGTFTFSVIAGRSG